MNIFTVMDIIKIYWRRAPATKVSNTLFRIPIWTMNYPSYFIMSKTDKLCIYDLDTAVIIIDLDNM